MSGPQLERIQQHFRNTAPYERPVWSKALAWHYGEMELAWQPECGWDFGIWADHDALVRFRKSTGVRPHSWATKGGIGLWSRFGMSPHLILMMMNMVILMMVTMMMMMMMMI